MTTISIIGRGIDPAKHLSIEGIEALRLAEVIVGIESENHFWKELQKKYGIQEVLALDDLYKNDDKDLINYNRFVNYILDLSKKYNNIALLVAGHPRVGVTFIELLKKQVQENIEIKVIDGISSFDTLLSYIGLDPLEQGTVLLDANRLLLFQYKLECALSYFIYHVCSIGNSKTNFLNPSQNNRIDLFKNYLLNYYEKSKKVFLCKISNGKFENSSMLESTIGELDLCLSMIDFSTTLYIPANKPGHLNWEYLNLLNN